MTEPRTFFSSSQRRLFLIATILLGIYVAMLWADLPPPAGFRYAPPPIGAGLEPGSVWDEMQGLRGWALPPRGWLWVDVPPAPIERWLLVLGLGAVGALVLLGAARGRVKVRVALALLVALGYALQLSFLWLKAPSANQLLFERILDLELTGYHTAAANIHDPATFFSGYADVIGAEGHLCVHCDTHPPGPLLYYWLPMQAIGALPTPWLEGLGDFMLGPLGLSVPPEGKYFDPTSDPAHLVTALLGGHLILLGAALIVIPLYGLARLVAGVGPGEAVALSTLGLVSPGIVLMAPQFDQVYATATATLLYLTLKGLALAGRPLWRGVAAGAFLALCLYWSFGLWLLGAIAVALAALHYFVGLRVRLNTTPDTPIAATPSAIISDSPITSQQPVASNRTRTLTWLAGLGVGTLVPWLILWLVGGLDVPRVLQIASEEHRAVTAARPYWPWVVFNLTDYLQLAGLPIVISSLFLLYRRRLRTDAGVQVEAETVHRSGALKAWVARVNPYLLIFWMIVIALDLSGYVRGEVGRLWIFLTPLLILGIYEAMARGSLGKAGLAFLIVAQFVVCVLIGGRWYTQ